MLTPDEIADRLAEARVDPTVSVHRMVGAAREAGVRGQTGLLKLAAVEYKRRCGQSVVDQKPVGTVRRAEAAGLLGVSVKRVDQLRAQGRLDGTRHEFTGSVWITLESVRRERGLRGLDRLKETP